MSKNKKRFHKLRNPDKYGVFYDAETDRILNVNDVEYILNKQQDKIKRDELSIKTMVENLEKLEKKLNKRR